MRQRNNRSLWGLGLLLLAVFLIMVYSGRGRSQLPHAEYNDATPLGGKGFRLVLNKLGYQTAPVTGRLSQMPADAKAWVILDPDTRFSSAESDLLLNWVKAGGTLLWAPVPPDYTPTARNGSVLPETGQDELGTKLGVTLEDAGYTDRGGNMVLDPNGYPLLSPINLDQISRYRTGVASAFDSAINVDVARRYFEIAGTPVGCQLPEIPWGKGRVIVLPDAMLCTNLGLVTGNNAELAVNLIRVSAPGGTVYFDERQHAEPDAGPVMDAHPDMLYYLWRPPVRWALLQALFAGLLCWALASRRLGTPIPLPGGGPVTRASLYANAMGTLFQRADRPAAAARIVGETFRRKLAARLGLSPADSDEVLAKRAQELAGLPFDAVDRLLLHSLSPSETDSEALRDAQEMEYVLRRLNLR